jgi:branched-chain amino acid transport system substrate-binding protein
MPSLANRSTPAITEYLHLAEKQGGNDGAAPSASRFEGFMHAKLFVEGLRRAATSAPTA